MSDAEKAADKIVVDKILTPVPTGATSGARTFHVQVMDDAGNITDLGAKETLVDSQDPSLTINSVTTNSTEHRMSANSGKDVAILNVTITDDCRLNRTPGPTGTVLVDVYATNEEEPEDADWKLVHRAALVSLDAGSVRAATAQNINVTYAQLAAAGLTVVGDGVQVYFMIKAKDDAQREGQSVLNKKVAFAEIDTVAPVCTSIALPTNKLFTNHADSYVGTDGEMTATNIQAYSFGVNVTDSGLTPAAATLSYKAWIDANASAVSVPAGVVEKQYVAAIPYADLTFASAGVSGKDLYLHIEYTDDVNNKAIYDSDAFDYDITAPQTHTITSPDTTSNPSYSRQSTVTLGYADDAVVNSKVHAYRLFGDITTGLNSETPITETNAQWVAVAADSSTVGVTIYYTPNADEPSLQAKTINVQYIDYAGNISTTANAIGYLEEEDPAVSMVLKDEKGNIISDPAQGTHG